MDNFGVNLKNLRKESRITQAELAEIVGVERSSIGKYETANVIPSVDVLGKIANFFNVSVDYLLGREKNSTAQQTEDGAAIFGKNLQDLRKNSGLLQKDMADKIGITKSAYGYYEQGKTIPDIVTAKKIAEILNVSVDYLLGIETEISFAKTPQVNEEKQELLELLAGLDDSDMEKIVDYLKLIIAAKGK